MFPAVYVIGILSRDTWLYKTSLHKWARGCTENIGYYHGYCTKKRELIPPFWKRKRMCSDNMVICHMWFFYCALWLNKSEGPQSKIAQNVIEISRVQWWGSSEMQLPERLDKHGALMAGQFNWKALSNPSWWLEYALHNLECPCNTLWISVPVGCKRSFIKSMHNFNEKPRGEKIRFMQFCSSACESTSILLLSFFNVSALMILLGALVTSEVKCPNVHEFRVHDVKILAFHDNQNGMDCRIKLLFYLFTIIYNSSWTVMYYRCFSLWCYFCLIYLFVVLCFNYISFW